MDKYDAMVTYFQQNPAEIYDAWTAPWNHKYGQLFAFLGEDGFNQVCGCPTQVVGGKPAGNPELYDLVKVMPFPTTEQMMDCQDDPFETAKVIPKLGLFAEAQRLADKMFPARVFINPEDL